jgi:hypothetical protein
MEENLYHGEEGEFNRPFIPGRMAEENVKKDRNRGISLGEGRRPLSPDEDGIRS